MIPLLFKLPPSHDLAGCAWGLRRGRRDTYRTEPNARGCAGAGLYGRACARVRWLHVSTHGRCDCGRRPAPDGTVSFSNVVKDVFHDYVPNKRVIGTLSRRKRATTTTCSRTERQFRTHIVHRRHASSRSKNVRRGAWASPSHRYEARGTRASTPSTGATIRGVSAAQSGGGGSPECVSPLRFVGKRPLGIGGVGGLRWRARRRMRPMRRPNTCRGHREWLVRQWAKQHSEASSITLHQKRKRCAGGASVKVQIRGGASV